MDTEKAAPETLAKAYDPSSVEDGIYARWEASGLFNPDNLPATAAGPRKEPYVIMMPPPNRTGILHVGHATGNAIQDLMTRFQRMRGKAALWLPGTDHAAIATQVKVEGLLRDKGMKDPRRELGREKFLEEVVKFAEESGATILRQTRKMGASCDWSRLAYTFDDARNRAVNRMFVMMHEDGLIERGDRIVNWDPQFQTTLSDDEVLMKETTARFLTFKYDADFPIAISTTRPETKFGDTAIAVHPDDARYAAFVGKTFTPTFCGVKLNVKVVADEAVDMHFGTGALGVTPAHSMIDADMAARHALPTVQVIGIDGRMNDKAGACAGLTVKEARTKIEAMLAEAGLLTKPTEEIPQNLPVAERGGAPVEQLPMKQWFVRANKPFALRQDTLGKWKKGEQATLKELMQEAVASGQVKILPEQSEKVYFHWIENLRDWCISRQIWFGHRVPAWYKDGEVVVAEAAPGNGWEQDPDTLDTWFSSGTWTFSTLGWPDAFKDGVKSGDLARFHPTDLLETGRDIIFFWVARMVLMSSYALGEAPFKTVYLHGLVRDEQGRKMSKSLGNIIDPLDVAQKYGTDAVRLSLVIGNTPGNDMRISDEKIGHFRNFTNKLWNISRFVILTMSESAPNRNRPSARPEPATLADRWILSRLGMTVASVTADLSAHNFSRAGETLQSFTWDDLADWYLEIAKIEGSKDAMLSYLLDAVLKLWHPFMPFVTEEIYGRVFASDEKDFLMVAEWPEADAGEDADTMKRFAKVQEIITTIRNIRSTHKVAPGARVDTFIFCGDDDAFVTEGEIKIIAHLAKTGQIHAAACGKPEGMPRPAHAVSAMAGTTEVLISLEGLFNPAVEKARLEKEFAEAKKYVTTQENKLANADFVSRAPEKVIAGEKQKLADAKEKAMKLEEQLAAL